MTPKFNRKNTFQICTVYIFGNSMGHALYARRSRQANAQGFDLEGLLKHRLLLLLLLNHSALKSHPQNQLHNNDKVKADPFKKGYSGISIVPQD